MAENKKEEKSISTSTAKSLVFIIHDTKDADLAEAFSNLLKSVSAGVLKSFRSSDKKGKQGIEFGIEWYPEIIKNIQNATDVVCLLTENSIDRPWILFEAGMARGKLNTPILGVALGVSFKKATTGPFAQFQNCDDKEDSLTKLIFQLVDRIPDSEPDEETIRFQVQKFKKNIDAILKKKKGSSSEHEKEFDNSEIRLFEEIKLMFQDLPSRIKKRVDADNRDRIKRRIHPMMIEELIHMRANRTVGMLMALSLIRDKLPWLYEIGNETIKIIRSDVTKKEKMRAVNEFEEIVGRVTHHPIMQEFMMMGSKEEYMFLYESAKMLQKNMQRLLMEK